MTKKKHNRIMCYGAGEMAEVYADFLSFLNVEIICWLDSDDRKTGMIYLGKKIRTPEEVLINEYPILITSIYVEEIKQRLNEIGADSRIISIDDLISEHSPKALNIEISINNKAALVFDAYDGWCEWAGTEIWALRLFENISVGTEKYLFVSGGMTATCSTKVTSGLVEYYGGDVCESMIGFLSKKLPIVMVQGFGKHAMLAAIYLKTYFPDKVRIVSVLHNDTDACVKRQYIYDDHIDRIFAVSKRVKDRAEKNFLNRTIDNTPQAVDIPEYVHKAYLINGIVHIGYAARLTCLQKRADLLIPLINKLERTKIKYILSIAGAGEFRDQLVEYVKVNKLSEKIRVLGKLKTWEMEHFWREQDVFLNMSEYEGCSLSMLEAMSYQCVPIVTDVSGVEEVVFHKENGYICEIGNLNAIISSIMEILDSEKLKDLGDRAYESIRDKCDYKNYIQYWELYISELMVEINAIA